jgi:nucleotide-binding universal stress UspA family protein
VIVAHCRAKPDDMIPYSTLLPTFARDTIMSQAAELADQEEEALREALHETSRALDMHETDAPDGTRATVQFIEEFGRMTDIIKHHGRLADIVVTAKPNRDRNLGTNALKSALFQTGRPVLMCPPSTEISSDFSKHVAVGWNGSLEAARSVALTLDLIAAAERVTILAAGSGEPHGATAEELRDYYRLRGIDADINRFDARKPGAALLEKSRDLGAGMLVMGAYGHSHERETLFGGNTQTVVDEAEIPVIMAH